MIINDPHAQFCCSTHGCRFGNSQCAVVMGQVLQINKCGESSICSEYQHPQYGVAKCVAKSK